MISGMALSACATLDEEECQSVSWVQLGQADGAAGHPSSYVELHREACAKHGIPVDDQQWQSGWQVGIRLYCAPHNGLLVGREGKSYENSCPADMASEFGAAYQVGMRVADARKEAERLRGELDSAIVHMEKGDKTEKVDRRLAVESLRTQLYGAELRLQLAEATYDRYLADIARGI
jgi:hypothetical protein